MAIVTLHAHAQQGVKRLDVVSMYISAKKILSFKILTFRCPFQHKKAFLRILSPPIHLSSSRSLRGQCKSW